VVLTADPGLTRNRHEIEAEGAFGRFGFWIEGLPLPGSPGSSSLAAMSMVRAVVARRLPLW
jgi:aspartate dehydrogenase